MRMLNGLMASAVFLFFHIFSPVDGTAFPAAKSGGNDGQLFTESSGIAAGLEDFFCRAG
jgi:hypothetical protein